MNFFKKQLLDHSICCIFVGIHNNAFLLSGSIVRTIPTLWLGAVSQGQGAVCESGAAAILVQVPGSPIYTA